MNDLAPAIAAILNVYTVLVFVRVILSWVQVDPRNTLIHILLMVTEPILAPLRRIVPNLGGFDITPMIAILILQLLAQAVLAGA